MSYWKSIDSDRYAAGRLWLPDLSVDLMLRDYYAFCLPLNCNIDDSVGSITTSYKDLTEVDLWLPDEWVGDQTLDDMSWRIYLKALFTGSGGDESGTVKIENGDNEAAINAATAATLTYTSETFTQGVLTLTVQVKNASGGATDMAIDHTLASGPNCYVVVMATP